MSPNLDPQAVLAAVYKAGSVDKAWAEFRDRIALKRFYRYCRDHSITAERSRQEFGGRDNVTIEAPQTVQVTLKPTYRISQKGGATSEKIKVLAIGDAHDSPTIPDKSRFVWMGRYARECGADILLSIGDMFSLDSLCSHERNDTLRGKSKPSFKQDMASAKLALAAVDEGLGDFRPERHITLGNHEDRIFSFTNRTPEMAELLEENLHTILTDYGWNYSPFGALHYIGGVAFTHVPLNTMGRPYGGLYAENQVARDSLEDVVFGHSHKRLDKSYPKTNDRHVRVVNLGSALPEGHIESYAKHSLNGWTYGIHEIVIQHGRIQHCHELPMGWLAERYG